LILHKKEKKRKEGEKKQPNLVLNIRPSSYSSINLQRKPTILSLVEFEIIKNIRAQEYFIHQAMTPSLRS